LVWVIGAGQALLEPSQALYSLVTLHEPLLADQLVVLGQIVPVGILMSAGQETADPSHSSTASQKPAAGLHEPAVQEELFIVEL